MEYKNHWYLSLHRRGCVCVGVYVCVCVCACVVARNNNHARGCVYARMVFSLLYQAKLYIQTTTIRSRTIYHLRPHADGANGCANSQKRSQRKQRPNPPATTRPHYAPHPSPCIAPRTPDPSNTPQHTAPTWDIARYNAPDKTTPCRTSRYMLSCRGTLTNAQPPATARH